MTSRRLRTIASSLALAGILQVQASDLDSARTLADKREYAAAISLYERALARQPDDSDVMIELARVYGWADRNKESAQLYRRIVQRHPDLRGEVVAALGWQTLWAGAPKDAVPLFKEAIKRDKTDAESAIGLFEALRDSGDEAAAAKQLDTILAVDPKQARALDARGSLRLDRGANELALNDFNAVLANVPNDIDGRVGRAKALDNIGRHRAAVKDYTALAAQLPKDEGVKLRLAQSLYWAGAEPEALDALKGLSIPEAKVLRDKIARERATRVGAGYEIASDSDGLRTQSALLDGRRQVSRTAAIDASYRSTWLDGLGTVKSLTVASQGSVPTTLPDTRSRVRGDQLTVGYSDRFGNLDSAQGMLFPRIALGARDYAGWKTPAVKASARWLASDVQRYDVDIGNEVVETIDAIANRVRFDYASAGFDRALAPRWSVGGNYLRGRFNDGNSRDRVTGVLEYTAVTEPKVTVGLEGLAMRDSRQATQDVTNLVAAPAGGIASVNTFSIDGRGYYNPKRYWEAKAFTTYGIERDRWSAWAKLALGGLQEKAWDGSTNSGLYTFGEVNLAYWLDKGTDLRFVAGRSGSRVSATESGGYHRSYGGLYLSTRF